MVFNATFNNISVISWLSALLVRKPEYPEKTTDLYQVTDQTLNHIMLYQVHLSRIRTHNVSGDRHSFIGSCRSNYHVITTLYL
jgi:hypothetical protein